METGEPPRPESGANDGTSGDAPAERDPDLVALEGLEAEFTELEAELARVEQSRGDGPAEPPAHDES